jgi:ribonucleotide reductase alpha subunit
LRNIIFNINDIWDKNNKTSVENQTIFNRLDDERNRISDCTENQKIKTRNFCKEIKIR